MSRNRGFWVCFVKRLQSCQNHENLGPFTRASLGWLWEDSWQGSATRSFSPSHVPFSQVESHVGKVKDLGQIAWCYLSPSCYPHTHSIREQTSPKGYIWDSLFGINLQVAAYNRCWKEENMELKSQKHRWKRMFSLLLYYFKYKSSYVKILRKVWLKIEKTESDHQTDLSFQGFKSPSTEALIDIDRVIYGWKPKPSSPWYIWGQEASNSPN